METNGNYERRIRDLEIWRATVTIELREAKDARERYIPMIEDLVKTDVVEKAVRDAIHAGASDRWSKREKLFAIVTVLAVVTGAILSGLSLIFQ